MDFSQFLPKSFPMTFFWPNLLWLLLLVPLLVWTYLWLMKRKKIGRAHV